MIFVIKGIIAQMCPLNRCHLFASDPLSVPSKIMQSDK